MSGGGPIKIETRELGRSPDLALVVAAARDAGHPVMLVERPVADAVSIAGIGVALEIVSTPRGVELLDGSGDPIDAEAGGDRIAAAGRLWRRTALGTERSGPPGTGAVALGGFAFHPGREPAGPWLGFPGLLLRVPALALARVRGRTFSSAAVEGAGQLLDGLV
ncbi:MAG: hypothetical protein ACREPA_12265, partial [Candidatus Dormibacteraceae bacterium]